MGKFRFVKYDHRIHLEFLFVHMTNPEEQMMFLSYHVNNSLRDFDGWIQDRLRYFYNDFFLIESQKDHKPIGMVYSYEQRTEDGHVKIAAYISPEFRKYGIGAFVTIQFIHYLFSYHPFRRIYCDVYDYNFESLSGLYDCGFERTGCLKEYRFYKGKYYDLHLLSITREAFYRHCSRLLEENSNVDR